jgi:hypothetical protein
MNWKAVGSIPSKARDFFLFSESPTSDQFSTETTAYITQNQHKTRTPMPSAGLEPTISAIVRPQTCAEDDTVTGIGF